MFESKAVLHCESDPYIVQYGHFAGPCTGSTFRYINTINPEWLPMARCERHAPLSKYGWVKG